MKTLIISAIIIVSFSISAKADYNKVSNQLTDIEGTMQQSSLSLLLTLYYDVKNALVKGDATTAADKAGEFVKAISGIDMKTLSGPDMNVFMSLQDKLVFDAKHISENKEISRQREHFSSFSSNFYKLAKSVTLTEQPVYYAYCPMRKAHWLSSEATIKNPYLGSSMLTCGKVEETLK